MQMQQPGPSIELIIRHIITETTDTRSFVLQPADGKEISYEAGQFLTLLFYNRIGDEMRRSYSISTASELSEPLTITVKRIANGECSRMLVDNAMEGDILKTIGASGFFILPGHMHPATKLFFFAAGSGITPVFALIKASLHTRTDIKIVLVYSNPSPERTIFYKQLKELEKEFSPRFRIHFLFSNNTDLSVARLNIVLLQTLFEKHMAGDVDKTLFFLCGPFEYMQMITIFLLGKGIQSEQIKREIFQVIKPVVKPLPPDQQQHHVKMILQGLEYHFDTQYPDTILQTARSLKIPVPYSCESGQCGTCAATCMKGKVWMWRNDVLMDDEVTKGRTLTCTGYAVDGDVELLF